MSDLAAATFTAADRLTSFGWSADLAAVFAPHAVAGLVPGRVTAEDRGSYVVATRDGEPRAAVTGRLRFAAGGDAAA